VADLLVTTADYDADRTWFAPDEVRVVVEVVSPESAHRDRTVKLRKGSPESGLVRPARLTYRLAHSDHSLTR
jgi:Uma2 family endonuclease